MNPRTLARIGGLLYLTIIGIGLWGEMFVRDKLVVSGDAMATAANIRAHETLWRVHIAAELFLLVCAIVLLQILFILLRPVNADLAWLAVFFNLVSISIEAVMAISLIETLFPLTGRLEAFTPAQLSAMSSLSLKSHSYGFGVSLLFFAAFCVVVGYLIFKSRYMPKTVGVLMQIAGVCYLVNSFALIVSPALANQLFPAILLPSFIGELSLALYLLIAGVNLDAWNLNNVGRASARQSG